MAESTIRPTVIQSNAVIEPTFYFTRTTKIELSQLIAILETDKKSCKPVKRREVQKAKTEGVLVTQLARFIIGREILQEKLCFF